MSRLLDEQRKMLDLAGSFSSLTPEDLQGYGLRNERLRELCEELKNGV
jgi:hypothetical protein